MKSSLALVVIILALTMWAFTADVLAQESGQCCFEATEDI